LFSVPCFFSFQFQIATITKDGANISKPFSIETHWELKRQVQPFRAD
jgi:hypothetical protein